MSSIILIRGEVPPSVLFQLPRTPSHEPPLLAISATLPSSGAYVMQSHHGPSLQMRLGDDSTLRPCWTGTKALTLTMRQSMRRGWSLHLAELNLDLLVLKTAWSEPASLAPLVRKGYRTLIVSMQGELQQKAQGLWCCGPLAEISAGRELLNMIPSGGPGVLVVNGRAAAASTTPRPVSLAQALNGAEGEFCEKAQRCLRDHIAQRYAPMSAVQWRLDLNAEALAQAVGLCLYRLAHPETQVVNVDSGLTLAPAWRRFLQNTGCYFINPALPLRPRTPLPLLGFDQRAGAALPHLEAGALSRLVPEGLVQDLAELINRNGEVIPHSLIAKTATSERHRKP